jgi:hypothetical protein
MRSPVAGVVLLAACAAGPHLDSPVRYHNADPVTVVNDRLHVPVAPASHDPPLLLYDFDSYVRNPLRAWLSVRTRRRAMNVTSLDEVPDSTWFTNRIGKRPVGVDELRRGPRSGAASPMDAKPWTIVSTKLTGAAVGFIVEDTAGGRYLLKFDMRGWPESESATHVIVQRLLWACGYNVPEDDIVELRREDLVLGKKAMVADVFGNKRPMTQRDLDARMALVDVGAGGTYRGLISRFVPGKPIGGYPRDGVRAGDPNDVIPHEHRRDVRGQYAIFAWLGHTDVKDNNTLDAWEPDPLDPSRRYVVHYLVDFGKAMGNIALMERRLPSGHQHYLDVGAYLEAFFTLGFLRRPWEGLRPSGIRGLGLFDVEHYDPGSFRTNLPYTPFTVMDRFDGFWGAKILVRFTPEHIRAAVEEGRYSDPRATETLTRVLIGRQHETARYWFGRVSPLDDFQIVDAGGAGFDLCFEDLLIAHGLHDRASPGRYLGASYGEDGMLTGWKQSIPATASGRACATGLTLAAGPEGYTIVRLVTRRGATRLPPVLVHIARHPDSGAPRVIGLWRM